MATHDYVIANGTGAAVRSDLNNALAAIVSNNSSATEPTTTYAYMWWADTTAGQLRLRNAADNGWVTIQELDGTMLMVDGTVAAPGLAFESDLDTGLFRPAANQLGIVTNGVERVKFGTSEVVVNDGGADVDFRIEGDTNANLFFVDAGNDRVGIGTATAARRLHVAVAGSDPQLRLQDTSAAESIWAAIEFIGDSSRQAFIGKAGTIDLLINNENNNGALRFGTNSLERARIDSDGRLLVGTSTARTVAGAERNLQIEGTNGPSSAASIFRNTNDASGPQITFGKSRGTSNGSNTLVNSGDNLGSISFSGADGSDADSRAAQIKAEVDGTPGANDMPGRLVFSTTADGASSPTERMRIDSAGAFLFNQTTTAFPGSNNTVGTGIADGCVSTMRNDNPALEVARKTSDGELVSFFQDSTKEGSISVSGSTVSYNGAHLSRWSQLPGMATREEILRGTVLSNIDEMCGWGDEDNEQLNRMKVSDVEGDKNVSGVFQAWDDDDDTYTDDFYCAMTGDFVIRIAQGVTVERGDLLMSAGDGTAKPQDDDIIRSKTIAKVTSTHVSETYADGSYCVPCVLMAC